MENNYGIGRTLFSVATSDYVPRVFGVGQYGSVDYDGAFAACSSFPFIYLKSNVRTSSGSGTIDSAYYLKI